MHAVLLDVELFVPERSERSHIEPTARLEVVHYEEDVVHDDSADGYEGTPFGVVLHSRRSAAATRSGSAAWDVFRW